MKKVFLFIAGAWMAWASHAEENKGKWWHDIKQNTTFGGYVIGKAAFNDRCLQFSAGRSGEPADRLPGASGSEPAAAAHRRYGPALAGLLHPAGHPGGGLFPHRPRRGPEKSGHHRHGGEIRRFRAAAVHVGVPTITIAFASFFRITLVTDCA